MFKDILSFFKNSDNSDKKKKVSPFMIILCAIIIIVPTAIAIFSAYFYEDKAEVVNNSIEIILYNADGAQIASDSVIESSISNSPLINIFYNILVGKESAPDAYVPTDEPNFKLTFKYKDTCEEFLCYFTDSHTGSFLKDTKGEIFSLEETSYDAFLNSEFSQDAYPNAQPPMLITGDGEEVPPTEASWYYLNKKLQSVQATPKLSPSTDTTYNISGAISLHFQKAPDSCVAKIYDQNGEQIYEGSLEELSYVKAQTNALLRTKITASWNNGENCSAYGQVTYSFNIVLVNRAEFSINKSEVTPGDFVIISIKNVQTLSKIIYSSDVADTANSSDASDALDFLYGYSPIFIKDGNSARAIIPFPLELPNKEFSFSISYGAAEATFTVNINERENKTASFAKLAEEISPLLSESVLKSLDTTLNGITATPPNIRFFRGQFASPSEYGLTPGYSFANTVTTADSLASFNAIGNEYTTDVLGGAPICALNVGTVIETNYCPYLGNYVVLEHGMGLRTWYCGLSDFNVKAGDVVAKGESVGKSGNGSLISTDGVIIMCTVYDTLIDPAVLWNTEFNYDIPTE